MKREIKFRIWDFLRLKMTYPDRYVLDSDWFGVTATHYLDDSSPIEYPMGDKNLGLMQYAGLKDKNNTGVGLYEGDVVYLAGYGDYICEFPFLQLYEALAEGDIGELKGNIYENPELLKP